LRINSSIQTFSGSKQSEVALSSSLLIKETCLLFGLDSAYYLCVDMPKVTNQQSFQHVFHSAENIHTTETAKRVEANVMRDKSDNILDYLHLFGPRITGGSVGQPQSISSTSILTKGILGETNILILLANQSELEWRRLKQSQSHELNVIGEYFHHITLRVLASASDEFECNLTRREIEVLRWSGVGKTYKDIASQLGISSRTVRFFLENARQKLGCTNTTHAVSDAMRRGLI